MTEIDIQIVALCFNGCLPTMSIDITVTLVSPTLYEFSVWGFGLLTNIGNGDGQGEDNKIVVLSGQKELQRVGTKRKVDK